MLTTRNLRVAARAACLSAALALLAQAAAWAATRLARLSDVSGDVLVTQGERFVRARSGMLVRPGERVIALAGAAVTITYESLQRGEGGGRTDCGLSLGENTLVLIVDGVACSHAVVSAADEISARPVAAPDAAKTADPNWPSDEPLVRCTIDTCLKETNVRAQP